MKFKLKYFVLGVMTTASVFMTIRGYQGELDNIAAAAGWFAVALYNVGDFLQETRKNG